MKTKFNQQNQNNKFYVLFVGACVALAGCAPKADRPYNSVSVEEVSHLSDQGKYAQLAAQDEDLAEDSYLIETAESDGPEVPDFVVSEDNSTEQVLMEEAEQNADALAELTSSKTKLTKKAKNPIVKNIPIPTKRPDYIPSAESADSGLDASVEKSSEVEDADSMSLAAATKSYVLPPYQSRWGLSRKVYDDADRFFILHKSLFPNTRYVTVVDFSKRSNQKRMFVFDLRAKTVESYYTSHGKGSDPKNTGLAQSFSNVPESHKSSLGAYKVLGISNKSKHGTVALLTGLENTNSNARTRAIIIHKANYVSEAGRAGRSYGCFALDPRIYLKVLNKVKGGSLLYVGR